MPLYKGVPDEPDWIPDDSKLEGNFYAILSEIIRSENPYGTDIKSLDITPTFDSSPGNRKARVDGLKAAGVRIMGWLRDKWSLDPVISSNNRMSLSAKQKAFHWTTLDLDEGSPDYPNVSDEITDKFPADAFDKERGGPYKQNSPDVELHQITKAIYIPIEYYQHSKDPNAPNGIGARTGRKLKAAIMIGFVGTGGGQ